MATFRSSILKVYLPELFETVEFSDAGIYTTDSAEITTRLRELAGVTEEKTKSDLLERARELDIEGRSRLPKDKLEKAIAKAESAPGKAVSSERAGEE